jgi:hypothetical protein
MNCRLLKIALITILSSLLWSGCSKDDDPATRSFYMGFELFARKPAEVSSYMYARLEAESDIISHRFDEGVPWAEALSGQPLPEAIMSDWNYRKGRTGANQKIYVSVTPINASGNGLAAFRGEADNLPLPAPWNTYTFEDADVRTAYLNYCKRIIDFFQPHFFNMAIEANLLYVNDPAQWSDYLQLHAYIYQQLKSAYPSTIIFTSVEGGHLLEGFVEGNDHVQQRLPVMQLMEHSDLYAVSFYPYHNAFADNLYPDHALDQLFSLSHKPLAVAETGYSAQPFIAHKGGGVIAEFDVFKQQRYTRDLLKACQKYRAVFVINEAPRMEEVVQYSFNTPSRDSGLYDKKGNPRPALMTWREFLSKKYQP